MSAATPLRVTYRAVFKSPMQGPLNPSGLPFAVSMTIEIYEAKKSDWRAREMDTGKKRPIPIPLAMLHTSAMEQIRGYFREQVTEWRMWGDVVSKLGDDLLKHGKDYKDGVRPIYPDEVELREGKVFVKQSEAKQA